MDKLGKIMAAIIAGAVLAAIVLMIVGAVVVLLPVLLVILALMFLAGGVRFRRIVRNTPPRAPETPADVPPSEDVIDVTAEVVNEVHTLPAESNKGE